MRRRHFILGGSALAAAGGNAFGQPARVHRVAYVEEPTASSFVPPGNATATQKITIVRQRLAELGFVEGRNVEVKHLFPQAGKLEIPELFRQAVAWNPEVLLVDQSPLSRGAQRATSTIPIVFTSVGDPLKGGLVANFKRPGGNITGVVGFFAPLVFKRLELIREVFPHAQRVAATLDAKTEQYDGFFIEVKNEAKRLNLEIVEMQTSASVREPRALVEQVVKAGADAAMGISPLPDLQGGSLLDLYRRLLAAGVPVFAGWINLDSVDYFLVRLGTDPREHLRRGVDLVARILSGEKPGDIAVDQDTRIVLTANLRVAREMGITLPKSVLVRANNVIE